MRTARFIFFSAVVALLSAGCRSGAGDAPAKARAADDPTPQATAPALPLIGLAVVDSARAWCAEFLTDSTTQALKSGQGVTIVFAGPATVPTRRTRVAGRIRVSAPPLFPSPGGLIMRRIASSSSTRHPPIRRTRRLSG